MNKIEDYTNDYSTLKNQLISVLENDSFNIEKIQELVKEMDMVMGLINYQREFEKETKITTEANKNVIFHNINGFMIEQNQDRLSVKLGDNYFNYAIQSEYGVLAVVGEVLGNPIEVKWGHYQRSGRGRIGREKETFEIIDNMNAAIKKLGYGISFR